MPTLQLWTSDPYLYCDIQLPTDDDFLHYKRKLIQNRVQPKSQYYEPLSLKRKSMPSINFPHTAWISK